MLRTTRASSDIGSQGGSQTTLTSTFPTPGTVETAFCTITGSSCADGQLGEVSDMSTFTLRSDGSAVACAKAFDEAKHDWVIPH